MFKKYWKMMAAAAFFVVAGISYGGTRFWDTGTGAALTAGPRETVIDLGVPGPWDMDAEGDTARAVDGSGNSGVAEMPDSGARPAMRPEEEDRTESCFVHVCGEVQRPGVYELAEGSRVFEAIEEAGGFTEQAARDFLNLAAPVCDGMKITVPNEETAALFETGAGEIGAAAGTQNGAEASGRSRLVNLNTATKEELMTLKGIGESKAEDIIRYREENGGFQKIEEIMKVPGIKDAGFQKIKDSITV